MEQPQNHPEGHTIPDWDSMLREATEDLQGVYRLIDTYRSTTSAVAAGCLIGVLTHCRRNGPLAPDQATVELVKLAESCDVWRIDGAANSLLAALYAAFYENGVPEQADWEVIANLLHRAAVIESSSFERIDLVMSDLLDVCAALASRNQLVRVLKQKHGLAEIIHRRLRPLISADEKEYGFISRQLEEVPGE